MLYSLCLQGRFGRKSSNVLRMFFMAIKNIKIKNAILKYDLNTTVELEEWF